MEEKHMVHSFIVDSTCYIFLASFKQLFRITEDEYMKFQNDDKDTADIIDKYVSLVNDIDRTKEKVLENKRYGLFLCVANACNALCTYCFAHQGDYGRPRGIMSKDIARRSIDYFVKSVPSNYDINLIYFGGEPMLAFEVIADANEYALKTYGSKWKIIPRIVTNATLLTKQNIDYLAENKFTVAVSIDGGREIQNSQRPLADGKDSFYEATKHLKYLLEKIPRTNARGTYVNFNYSLSKLYQELLDLGFSSIEIPPDILHIDNKREMNTLFYQMNKLYSFILEYLKNHDDFPFDLFTVVIRGLFVPKYFCEYSCGAGKNILAVDISGDIYPCHRFSSESDMKIGNVLRYVDNPQHIDVTKTSCNSCWNKYTCSHGCAYNDFSYHNGDINPFWCEYSKKMTELSLALCANMRQEVLSKIIGL